MKNKNEKIVITINDDTIKKEKTANDKRDEISNFKLQIKHLKEMIERTILAHHQYKIMDILSSNDVNLSIQYLEKIYRNLESIENDMCSKPPIETKDDINLIIGELSSIFRNYGTQCIHDLLEVTFGNNYKKCALLSTSVTATANMQREWDHDKYAVLKMYFRPINFKMLAWKNDKKSATSDKLIQKNKIVEDFVIVEKSANLDCFDMARTNKNFASRVFGIKVAVHNYVEQKTIIIGGIVDNVFLDCTSFDYITHKISNLWKNVPKDPEFMAESFTKFMKSLTLKDTLVFSNDEIYSKYLSNITFINSIKLKQTSQLIKEFMNTDLYSQRSILIQLLLKSHEHEFKYLSYMLYDMLSNEINPQVESNEQTALFNSLPWNIKLYFKDAMKQTVSYTNAISKYESGNMTLEQQICLLKTTDAIKEKAMVKLREIKSKSDDTTTKARQYLEGLLKIPFGIYSREQIMEEMKTIKDIYSKMCVKNEIQQLLCNETNGHIGTCANADKTVLEIKNTCIQINNSIEKITLNCIDNFIRDTLDNNRKKNTLVAILNRLTTFVKKYKLQPQIVNNNSDMVATSNKTIQTLKSTIEIYIKNIYKATATASTLYEHVDELFKELIIEYNLDCKSPISIMRDLRNDTNRMTGIMENVGNYVENVRNTLDNAGNQPDTVLVLKVLQVSAKPVWRNTAWQNV